MAVTIYGNEYDELVDPQELYRSVITSDLDVVRVWPYPVLGGVRASYLQKCVDTVTGVWTFWETFYQDRFGQGYPGAGFDAATYRIVTIKYEREQS